ncbi:NAD(P)-binding protein [Macrolepiota fuliginosa MF-IS2]|uniref:NAD(P)-binding protein n=1 Tax=Macrolepiota fuliginosa MF-IS2 TaxID=1400762 RepID=A0A9P5XAQ2_9AGAR|nr:NAD(P)-binding protein [Macrolepiota fuliginosa MF-IS2]
MAIGVALVTGASRGIGRAVALRLAADGYSIALNDLPSSQEVLRVVEAEVKGLGREVIICVADVTKEIEVQSMIDIVVVKLGGLDVMVANAGICVPKPFLETTLDDWDEHFNVNGKGVYLCYLYAAKQMIKQSRGGRIIGACSLAGKQGTVDRERLYYARRRINGPTGSPLLSIYSATKFAVRSLTQTAAIELAKHNITVNAYAPGFVKTTLMDQFVQGAKPWGVTDSIYKNAGTPEEIAGLVSYLASKDARHVTGQSININGGRFFD